MKKTLNIVFACIPFLAIGFSFGVSMCHKHPGIWVYVNVFFAIAVSIVCAWIRSWWLGGTPLYTEEEFKAQGKQAFFEFEEEK